VRFNLGDFQSCLVESDSVFRATSCVSIRVNSSCVSSQSTPGSASTIKARHSSPYHDSEDKGRTEGQKYIRRVAPGSDGNRRKEFGNRWNRHKCK
jgi:hypothetical protein